MNINLFKLKLQEFTGTMLYHKISVFPLLATDGVAYFCENASAYWLFDDMALFTLTQKNQEFIVVNAVSKNKKCDVFFDDGNNNKLGKKHYKYTDLPEGNWKFYISNYPTEKIIMLPSEY